MPIKKICLDGLLAITMSLPAPQENCLYPYKLCDFRQTNHLLCALVSTSKNKNINTYLIGFLQTLNEMKYMRINRDDIFGISDL